MCRLDGRLASSQVKLLQTSVPKRPNHAHTVARSASRVKIPIVAPEQQPPINSFPAAGFAFAPKSVKIEEL
jgi:hypothetical protein